MSAYGSSAPCGFPRPCSTRCPSGSASTSARAASCRGTHLHLTLAFLGHRPAREVTQIAAALRASAEAAEPIRLLPERYRETRSVGMLVLKDLAGTATRLAGDLFRRLEELGVHERERRPWLPHVTVVRFRKPPRLESAASRSWGRSGPSDAAVYLSVLWSTGARVLCRRIVCSWEGEVSGSRAGSGRRRSARSSGSSARAP